MLNKIMKKRDTLQTDRLLEPIDDNADGIQIKNILEISKKYILSEDWDCFLEQDVRNFKEYEQFYVSKLSYRRYEEFLSELCSVIPDNEFQIEGYCEVCKNKTLFLVDWKYADYTEELGKVPNWRERLVCPSCNCNNRMRFMIDKISQEYSEDKKVLMYESGSALYRQVSKIIPDVQGLKITDENLKNGHTFQEKLTEDPCRLSFGDETFDLLISNDIFEHIRNYKLAFREACRVLKKGGKMIFTVSFNIKSDKIELCLNPAHEEGIPPIYQIFGWDILRELEMAGFTDAYAKVYYSLEKGYMGYLPLYFEAVKGETDFELKQIRYIKNLPQVIDFGEEIIRGTEEELRSAIGKHDIISFDIFDTLIMRKTFCPEDVFDLVEYKARKSGIAAPNYKEMRIRAQLHNGLHNADIYEIYESYQELTGITDLEKEQLRLLEIECERQVLIRREKVVELFHFALELKKQVYIISNMYLPKTILDEILRELNIVGYKEMFVSCDYKQLKEEGLFRTFKREVQGNSYLHIGDNAINDGVSAEENGIDSFLIASAAALWKESKYSGLNKHIGTINEKSIVGLSISSMFNNPFVMMQGEIIPQVNQIKQLAHMYMAPIVTSFVIWFLKNTQDKDYDGILFAARDGYLIQQLYKLAVKALDAEGLKDIYFQTSRKAAVESTIEGEAKINLLIDISKDMQPEEVLADRFGLSPEEIKPYDGKKYRGIHQYIWEHQKLFIDKARNNKKNYIKYLGKLNLIMGGKYIFYDFVASGTCQKALESFCPFSMDGVYFGWNGDEQNEINVQAYIGKENQLFMEHYKFMEIFMTSLQPSLKGFNNNGEPVFLKEKRTWEEREYIEKVQKEIFDYFNDYINLLYIDGQDIGQSLGSKMYSYLAESENNFGQEIINELDLIDDWGGKCEKLRN